MKYSPLSRKNYNRDVRVVAQELVGQWLLRETDEGLAGGRIVEVEAYLAADDPACHAARGQTRRNATMFGPPGHAYVYAIHSRWCVNAVTEPSGVASAVLIRAIEPIVGIELMQARRKREALRDLARGPGRLCEALGIDCELDGWDLTRGDTLWVAKSRQRLRKSESVGVSTRIGVTSAHDLQLRYFLAGSPWVSGRKTLA